MYLRSRHGAQKAMRAFSLLWCIGEREKGYCVNVGRWGNRFINIEDMKGEVVTKILPWHLKNSRWYDVKLVSTSESVEFYVNGRLVVGYKPVMPRQFYAAGYDEEAGETVVKVVNAANAPYKVRFHLAGGTRVEAKGHVLTLAPLPAWTRIRQRSLNVFIRVRVNFGSLESCLITNSFLSLIR